MQDLPPPEEIEQLPPDGGEEFNRLIFETSPYLLQHARNPVDWYPWGEEAFERAKAEDRPIFLSVGYSTCHWCHVMARESFEDRQIADVLNEHFVPIKVDREERPDVDEIYMIATQLIAGRGGWPNSVWLTPDLRPFYAGTYFPPQGSRGVPGFKELLLRLADAWQNDRERIEAQANQLTDAIQRSATISDTAPVPLTRALIRGGVEALADRFDERFGGFGAAPKFPPHASLRLLLDHYRHSDDAGALHMAVRTLEAMARGGIHDHVSGGFHRYSTDEFWLVPHFEKMLYDNAQLARSYADAFAITGATEFEVAARGICDWVLRDMTDDVGGFYSALDADSDGVEGKFYVWTREEIIDVLGGERGALAADIFNARENGNFREEETGAKADANILHLDRSGLPNPELWPFVQQVKDELLERRNGRVWPHRDEKILAAWNGLMIGGLAVCGDRLDEPDYIDAAARAAGFVLEEMMRDGRLMRSWRDGRASGAGYLDDYAFMAEGLLDLHLATGEQRWLDSARMLAETMLELFEDRRAGGFFFTASDNEELLARVKRPFDQAEPSGNGVAALVLVRLADLTGEDAWVEAAERTLTAFSPAMRNAPTATQTLLVATRHFLDLSEGVDAAEEPAGETEPDAMARRGPVVVHAYASRREVRPGQQLQVALRVEIADGWHISSHEPGEEDVVATKVKLDTDEPVELMDVAYPDAMEIRPEFSDRPISVYDGVVWIRASIGISPDAEEGHLSLPLALVAQPCDDSSCAKPERYTLELPLRVDEAAPARPRHEAIFSALDAGQVP